MFQGETFFQFHFESAATCETINSLECMYTKSQKNYLLQKKKRKIEIEMYEFSPSPIFSNVFIYSLQYVMYLRNEKYEYKRLFLKYVKNDSILIKLSRSERCV